MSFLYFLLLTTFFLRNGHAQKPDCPKFDMPLCLTICDPSCEEKHPYEKLACRKACVSDECAPGYFYITNGLVGGRIREIVCPGGEMSFVVDQAHYFNGNKNEVTNEVAITPNVTVTIRAAEPTTTDHESVESHVWSEELVS